jgi:3-oxoacyl-(acyl-carrier-protein) synthase/phosphopantetheinyl transferase/malonyl CoA-acyl carrier protein transacylase
MINDSDVAVVGMSCVFPGAGDIDTYWNNIVNKVDAIQDAPENRIAKVFYDPDSHDLDRLYCNRGGFIDEFLDFDPIQFGIVPNTIKGTEPDHLLSLKLTHKALEDAMIFEKNISLERAGIIIGKGNFGGLEMGKISASIMGGENLVQMLKVLVPSLSMSELYNIKKKYQEKTSDFGVHNVMGTVPNLVASIVANRFNFGGPAYTVDAACASSLIAIDQAVSELCRNRCNIVVAGAMHVAQTPPLWSAFSMLGAFSKTQIIRPFDKKADGVLAGEGCGFVVLMKLKDAIKEDLRIYATIKGTGVSSDGAHASLMSPAWQGQIKAIKSAWQNASLDFDQIGYIEAHGTATIVGDKTELQTMKEAFPYNNKLPRAGIGSVKSMIGHAMSAAGMAGFIKTVMAVHKGILPPTLNCNDPVDAMYDTRFMPVQEATEWEQTGLPLVAGINAFGFGGANAHVVIEKFNNVHKHQQKYHIPLESNAEDVVVLLARNSQEELVTALKSGDKNIGAGKYRLALFHPDPKRIDLALRIIQKDKPWRNKQDIWFTNEPLLLNNGKIAFMFPGLDMPSVQSLLTGNFKALADYFNLPTYSIDDHEEGLKQLIVLDEARRLTDICLKKLGVLPDVVAGHSIGELTACATVGMTDLETINTLIERSLNRKSDKMDAVFLNVNCGIHEITDLLEQHPGVYLSDDNCPHQITLCAKQADAERFRKLLTRRNLISYILPSIMGYHSPLSEIYIDEMKYCVENIVKFKPPQFPIWSSISTQPYPKKVEEIQQLHIDFVTKPVLFRQLVENVYNDGVRMFIQIGAGSLPGFINDILSNREFALVSSGSTTRETLSQLRRVLAALFIEGKNIDTKFLGLAPENDVKKKKGLNMKLDLSLSFTDYKSLFSSELLSKIQKPSKVEITRSGSHPVFEAFKKNMKMLNNSQEVLLNLISKRKIDTKLPLASSLKSKEIVSEKVLIKRNDIKKSVEISLEKYPELNDHCPFRKRSNTDNFDQENEPVVPLTMFIDLFFDCFRESFPGSRISKIINTKVFQFLWVKKPQLIEITGKWVNYNTIQFEIDKYIKATFLVDQEIVNGDMPPLKVTNPITSPITAEDIYNKGFMFHGPAYHGIRKIQALSNKGIETQISGVVGKGGMLDNIGQSIVLFYQLSAKDMMPFPVGAKEITFYQDPSDQTGVFNCICILKSEDDDFFYSDIELTRAGKRWALVKGWQNRKSEQDPSIREFINGAEGKSLSTPVAEGITLMISRYKRLNTWFFIASVYLNASEMDTYDTLTTSKQKEWLLGRIAAKDAIRNLIMKDTAQTSHPASFTIVNDPAGQPQVHSKIANKINVSIAHKNGHAVAYASKEKPVGIDLEEIREKDEGFIDLVLSEEEKSMLELCENKNEWITRFWVAKEAYGKSLGVGLKGNPKRYTVTSIKNETLTIENVVVETIKHQNFIIGYTL